VTPECGASLPKTSWNGLMTQPVEISPRDLYLPKRFQRNLGSRPGLLILAEVLPPKGRHRERA